MPTDDSEPRTSVLGEHVRDHEVSRDPNFVRVYADTAVSLRAPRSLEIALLKIGSELTVCTVDEGEEAPTGYMMKPSVSELGRVTLPISVALGLAMDMLSEILPSGVADLDKVEEDLKKFIAEGRAAEQSDD